MNCDCRRRSLPFAIGALTSTVCVVLSTCGEIKLTRVSAITFPLLSRICTGAFIFNCDDRSTGTYTYASRLPAAGYLSPRIPIVWGDDPSHLGKTHRRIPRFQCRNVLGGVVPRHCLGVDHLDGHGRGAPPRGPRLCRILRAPEPYADP